MFPPESSLIWGPKCRFIWRVEQLLIFYGATVATCLPQSLRCVYAKPLRVIESLTNELEAYTSERKIGLLRLVRLILTADY